MLQSIQEATGGIMRILSNEGSLTIPFSPAPLVYPVHAARKSAEDLTEKFSESYPQVSLFDYIPEPGTDFNTNFSNRVDEFSDFNVDGEPTKGVVFKEPTQVIFKYDLNFFTKNPMERYAIVDYMMRTYADQGSLCVNAVELPEGNIGEMASYRVTYGEVPRTDKVFELSFTFTFKVFVYLSTAEQVDLVETFNLYT